MSRVLLTGFEPFAGQTCNPSHELLQHIETQLFPMLTIHKVLLPVDSIRASQQIQQLLVDLQPNWCIMFGQADGATAMLIERVAINLGDFRIPDNGGRQPVDQAVVEGGANAYFSSLPVKAFLHAIQEAGVPAQLSLSAGAYVCNYVMYSALHICSEHNLTTRCGFIHVPSLPQQYTTTTMIKPTMALETMVQGTKAILQYIAS